ncbi:MAG TPA: nucleoside-triphosphatase [Spirochaetota bacterium]|nr:nucleoside-triphosphatase [Spirochaetota bacterium]HRS78035.1 nucleoside-triphosphatase [Spirochaetota bacterium]HRT76164.1 nucleoside-triphosphatase [Spirochaetota bacterium]
MGTNHSGNTIRKNIFLTGAPSAGKTTMIKKLLRLLDRPAQGFYTEEEKNDGRRVGFMMNSLDGRRGYLAHQDIRSEFSIRRYGVSVDNIDSIAADSIIPKDNTIIVLDEIGTMECYSEHFRRMAIRALDSPNIVVGTVALGGDDFIKSIKERADIDIIEVTPSNRNALPDVIARKIKALKEGFRPR